MVAIAMNIILIAANCSMDDMSEPFASSNIITEPSSGTTQSMRSLMKVGPLKSFPRQTLYILTSLRRDEEIRSHYIAIINSSFLVQDTSGLFLEIFIGELFARAREFSPMCPGLDKIDRALKSGGCGLRQAIHILLSAVSGVILFIR